MLGHPNIPKPLHGLAPRAIMGNAWWKEQRTIALAEHGNRCWSCGVHSTQAEFYQRLEAHETYDIDFAEGLATFSGVVALCHSCHMFIHSGRLLSVLKKGEVSESRVMRIVDRGLTLCMEKGITPFIGLKELVDYLGFEWHDYWKPEKFARWDRWRLSFNGKEYPTRYADIDAWARRYGAKVTDADRRLYGCIGDEQGKN
jgi:hypothetical protein